MVSHTLLFCEFPRLLTTDDSFFCQIKLVPDENGRDVLVTWLEVADSGQPLAHFPERLVVCQGKRDNDAFSYAEVLLRQF